MNYDILKYNEQKFKFIRWIVPEYIVKDNIHGYHETNTLDIIRNLNLDGAYIDVGAYIGTHSMVFSKMCNADKIISFEPQKEVFSVLNKNIELNECKNIETHCCALGNEEGTGKVSINDSHRILHNYGATRIKKEKGGNIPIHTLDSFNIKNINFIKIDTEGSEIDILRGAKNTLINNQIPYIMTECGNKEYEEIQEEFMLEYGYKKYKKPNENIIWKR